LALAVRESISFHYFYEANGAFINLQQGLLMEGGGTLGSSTYLYDIAFPGQMKSLFAIRCGDHIMTRFDERAFIRQPEEAAVVHQNVHVRADRTCH
jgi:hypothetical protein